MSNLAGDIDEIIGEQALKRVETAVEKMGALYVSFKENVTAINLMNDALSKSTGIKEVTKKYDTFMGGGWALYADEVYSLILMYEQEKEMPANEFVSVLNALTYR